MKIQLTVENRHDGVISQDGIRPHHRCLDARGPPTYFSVHLASLGPILQTCDFTPVLKTVQGLVPGSWTPGGTVFESCSRTDTRYR